MNQALKLVAEINRKKEAMKKTKSQYLKNDYSKRIRDDMFELRDYCQFKGLNLIEIARLVK